jgi:hypothetical protein
MRKIPFLFLSLFLALFGLVTMASLVTAANNQTSITPQSEPALMSTLLVAENFDYGNIPGDLTTVSSGAWVAHSGAGSGPVQYITASLSMPGYGSSGVGGAATISTGGAEDVHRPFADQTSEPVYFSALVNVSTAQTGDYFFHLSNAGTLFRARIFVRDSAGNLQYGLGTTSAATYSADNFDYDTTYLVVGKYDPVSGDTSLYVLDAAALTEPATPLVTLAGAGAQNVERVAIRQGTAGQRPAAIIDGVRVANSWADVIGEPSGPSVLETNPADGTANVELDATVTITFNEAVTVTTNWFDFSCTTSGTITGTTAPASPAEAYVITPANPFVYDEACTVTVLAAEVTNSGGLTMTTNYSFTFATESLIGDITFVYHDLEGVLQAGESIYLAGDFTDWITQHSAQS